MPFTSFQVRLLGTELVGLSLLEPMSGKRPSVYVCFLMHIFWGRKKLETDKKNVSQLFVACDICVFDVT